MRFELRKWLQQLKKKRILLRFFFLVYNKEKKKEVKCMTKLDLTFDEFGKKVGSDLLRYGYQLRNIEGISFQHYRNIPDLFSNEYETTGSLLFHGKDGYYAIPYGKVDGQTEQELITYALKKIGEKEKYSLEQVKSNYNLTIDWLEKRIQPDYQFRSEYMNLEEFKLLFDRTKPTNFRAFFDMYFEEKERLAYEVLYYAGSDLGKMYVETSDAIIAFPVTEIDAEKGYEQIRPSIEHVKYEIDKELKQEFQYTKTQYEESLTWIEGALKNLRIRELFQKKA